MASCEKRLERQRKQDSRRKDRTKRKSKKKRREQVDRPPGRATGRRTVGAKQSRRREQQDYGSEGDRRFGSFLGSFLRYHVVYRVLKSIRETAAVSGRSRSGSRQRAGVPDRKAGPGQRSVGRWVQPKYTARTRSGTNTHVVLKTRRPAGEVRRRRKLGKET